MHIQPPLAVNLRHLEKKSVRIEGESPPADFDLDFEDEIIEPQKVRFDLEVQKLDRNLVVQGRLRVALRCRCVRCLKPFAMELDLGDWRRHVSLDGEDRVPVVNDRVDLTPLAREDILLGLPQYPLCGEGCRGLPKRPAGGTARPGKTTRDDAPSPAWAALNKLKFEK